MNHRGRTSSRACAFSRLASRSRRGRLLAVRQVCLLWLASACTTAPAPAPPAPIVVRRFAGHAHNDYQHGRPLLDALDLGFRSVEADVYYASGKLAVSHDGRHSDGTLESLYLDVLQARIASHRGSVYGDGEPFRLVIDLKDGCDELPAAIAAVFARYSMLSRFDGDSYVRGPVEVVFTGDEAMKRAVVARTHWGTRDSGVLSSRDPVVDARWTDYAFDWSHCIDWNGEGAIPDDDRRALSYLVGYAHALHRKIRFYGAPDRPAVWAAEAAAGVDFIGTDDLAGLARFSSGSHNLKRD